MDLWQLHIFCKVVELKSFSRSGETIHLSQPTISSHKKSIPIKALLGEAFIIRESGSGTLTSIGASLSAGGYGIDDLNVVAEMGSTVSVCQAIKSGVGISILSALAVAEEIGVGTLKALSVDGLKLTRSFFLSWHKIRSLSPLSRVFIEYLKKEVQKK